MPLEKEGFREQLERLDKRFGGRETITIVEACTVTGFCREVLLADKTFPVKRACNNKLGKIAVPLVGLARWMVNT